jgi:FkbM family methyltransferase
MKTSQIPAAIRCAGLGGTLKLLASRRKLRRFLPATGRLTLRGYPFPFHFRRVATDKYVIAEVLVDRQYECLTGWSNVGTIVDAGANIGTTSVFLLNAYPEARLIALEPDPGNFALLQTNLHYYGRRAAALRVALWDRSEPLTLSPGRFRDGGEWSTQVRSSDGPSGDVQGVTLAQLMREYNINTIDILKVDIEGAERRILGGSFDGCLRRIGVLAIELHDEGSRRAFERAIAGNPGEVSHYGEVTLWRRTETGRHHHLPV